MLSVLVDTSTWLDLAGSREGQLLLVPLRQFERWGELRLLVPALVMDEFDRNRPHAEERVTKSITDRVKILGRDLDDIGIERSQEWVGMTQRVQMVSGTTLKNFRETRELLERGYRLDPSAEEQQRVVRRALDKRAPFHLAKNSVADALLMELYRTATEHGEAGDSFVFVTSNHKDFSATGGDQRQPHPDLAELFDGTRSRYCLGVDGLRELMANEFGEAFAEEVAEVEFLQSDDESRTYGEIVAAAEEYFDKVWYIRHLIHLEQEERGEIEPMNTEIRAGAEAAAQRVVERYGPENVGPWDDWHWGFVNGQLATLRWVLGTAWDDEGLLDT
ncbi:PIN domain-containing protein [Actinomycetospora sp. NBC_00405]|uniref:PIN domain-containing protein n=1 Tax=Actinomycetospora sp. NBC_00405 TaxID=2975952 RepID=UPI002E1A9010